MNQKVDEPQEWLTLDENLPKFLESFVPRLNSTDRHLLEEVTRQKLEQLNVDELQLEDFETIKIDEYEQDGNADLSETVNSSRISP